MKRYIYAATMLLAVLNTQAQETYENARTMSQDLNGTARYVGMGGAMDALGADISTIGTNPAGVGLFRRSSISVSAGLQSQQDAKNFGSGHTTNMSLDQVGFVWAKTDGEGNTLNFAFNYHKSRNFNYILQASAALDNASQNKLTATKGFGGMLFESSDDGVPNFSNPMLSCNQVDYLYARNWNYSEADTTWYDDPASKYQMDRAQQGYISDFDFNVSGGNGRVWLGLTVGIHDVHYKHYSIYQENVISEGTPVTLSVGDDRQITGQGFDIKAGIIFRPIESSPLRFGLSVHSPSWYTLTTSNYTILTNGVKTPHLSETYKFKVYTPWRFGASAGYTIGKEWALGLSYDYASYGSMDTRRITGESYNYWDNSYYEESESDNEMNRHTAATLKGVHTLKLGAELKPIPAMAIRVGYNYVSSMYEKSGFKDGTIASDGTYFSSATDFTNWRATHRLTCGFGYQVEKWNFALAYQYSQQNGDFYPFTSTHDEYDASYDNIADAQQVSNKRHQVMATVSYTF